MRPVSSHSKPKKELKENTSRCGTSIPSGYTQKPSSQKETASGKTIKSVAPKREINKSTKTKINKATPVQIKAPEKKFLPVISSKDEEFSVSSAQKTLHTLFEYKMDCEGLELHRRIQLVDREVLKKITKQDIVEFCKSTQLGDDTPSICRLYIPKNQKSIEMDQVLLYNAYYPWDVEPDSDDLMWHFATPIFQSLAYATFYGHPIAPKLLYHVYAAAHLHRKGVEFPKAIEKILDNRVLEDYEVYVYYQKESTVISPNSAIIQVLDAPAEEVRKVFDDVYFIAINGHQK
jgi:hypothetical protein